MAKQNCNARSGMNKPVVTLLNMILSAIRPPSIMHIRSNSYNAVIRCISSAVP